MRGRRRVAALIAAVAAVTTIGVSIAGLAAADGQEARARLVNASGATVGRVRLVADDGKIVVRARVTGFAPGFHGFHIHTVGVCDPSIPPGQTSPFTSAGGHFNPSGASHANHAGDQPVLLVNADGTAWASFETDRYELADLFDADGSAFIVHVSPDNYANVTRYGTPDAATLATGDAGARVACGVIREG